MEFTSTPAGLLFHAADNPRPIFVLEQGASRAKAENNLPISFCNDAFRESPLEGLVNGNNADAYMFRQWTSGSVAKANSDFAAHRWTRTDVTVNSQNLFVITGTPRSETTSNGNDEDVTDHHPANIKALRECVGKFVTPSLDIHLDLIENRDWSMAGLKLWPRELLELIRMVLILDAPLAMTLGDAGLLIYNESYASKIAGSRHPRIMGMPLEDAWPEGKEMRAEHAPIIAAQGFHNADTPVAIAGDVEKFCTWTMMETSERLKSQLILSADCSASVIQERRRSACAVLRDQCANLNSFDSFCANAGKTCLADPQDVSFMLCYQIDSESKTPRIQTTFPQAWFDTSSTIDIALSNAMHSNVPIFLTAGDGTLPLEWQDLATLHGFGDRAKIAMVSCLRSGSELNDIHGIVVVGLNPRRPLDTTHRAFADSFMKELSVYALSAVRREAEVKTSVSQTQRLDNFAKLFEMTDVGFFEYGSDWKLRRANDAYFDWSGYPRDLSTQTSMTFVDLLHPEDLDFVLGEWSKLAVDAEPCSFEFRWKWHRDNLTDEEKELGGQWVLASCLPILELGRDDTTSLVGAMGVMISNTQAKLSTLNLRKRAEALELARDTEERFKAFAENAPAGVYIYDSEPKLSYCNHKYFELMGSEKTSNFADHNFADYIFEDDLESVRAAFKALMEDHKPVSHQFRLKRMWTSPDGVESEAYLIANSYPVFDEEGKLIALQGIVFDTSHFHWAERIQKARVAEAVEAKKQQERFIDMTSHELRNPLSAVVQCTEIVLDNMKQVLLHARLILRGTTAEAQEQYKKVEEEITTAVASLRTVEECTGHMRRIIDDVLSLSKLDAKLLTINPSTIRFEDAIRDCTGMFFSAARAGNVDLDLEADTSISQLGIGYVDIDAGRVGQIIANLVTNSIKFTRTEAVRRILVRYGTSKERPVCIDNVEFSHIIEDEPQKENDPADIFLWCSVIDTGSGLSEAQQSLLFHRFSQAFAPKTLSKYGGSGLGLYISKSLCELQGGEIGVYSAGVGKGSTFAFFIKSVSTTPLAVLTPSISNDPARIVAADIDPAEIGVIVVEDNIVNSKVLVQQLKKKGFMVHVAYHGGEALEVLQKSRQWKGNSSGPQISIITMDVEMPVMGGLECSRAIRQHEAEGDITCHIPIIAVSANARQEQMDETRAAGMDDSIAKPFRIKELLSKIQRLVQQARLDATTT